MSLAWYFQRVQGMSASEVVGRTVDQIRQAVWVRRRVRPGGSLGPVATGMSRIGPVPLGPAAEVGLPNAAVKAVVDSADEILAGRWDVLGVTRRDLQSPDWFLDPVTGRTAPRDRYAFRINHRSEEETGNVKQVWELSRHHHLTLLAAAWYCTHDDRYAEIVDSQLRSWWRQNPFLSGVHWTSGIELGLRLISWVWIRRLLHEWPGVRDLFENNEDAARQIQWHQEYLAAFPSRGSSANNHVIAEAAGQLIASCGFPWFESSARWRSRAKALFESELERNTFPSGVNRELASDYHGFVAELALVAAVEADAAGESLSDATWARTCSIVDAACAVVDERCRPPRQGDGDQGRALVVDGGMTTSWSAAMACGAALFDPLPWWPPVTATVESALILSLCTARRSVPRRPAKRPAHFADAGLTVLRAHREDAPEIWCRCDGGPHGHLSIAAHAHADALSIEVRYGGVDLLADPGTYCYHGEPQWRSYFRSTIGHNTVELDGANQSQSGGPFLWTRSAKTHVERALLEDPDGVQSWSAEHHGYEILNTPARHRRTVELDTRGRKLAITDRIESAGLHIFRLAFHFGPTVRVVLDGDRASLRWRANHVLTGAVVRLPGRLDWSVHRGELEPPLGWYSPRFGEKVPATTLVGAGLSEAPVEEFHTRLEFDR